MPELPEVETVRRTLKNIVIGAKITGVTILCDKIVAGDPDEFASAVSGETIADIDRRGKYLVFVLGKSAFISHLRMEGKYLFVDHAEEIAKHDHVIFNLEGGKDLRYRDVRKFGRMMLTDKQDYIKMPPLSGLGPEPWEANPDAFWKTLGKSSLPIKSILLKQNIIAGVGNIYADEICFRARLHPGTAGKNISREQAALILEEARAVLTEAIERGGTTIHSFSSGGISGRFQNELKVHTKDYCPVCKNAVVKIKLGGRGTYFCPECQKYT